MEQCFIGHQTWLVKTENAEVIVDPILKDSFGANDQFGIQVYPPRNVDTNGLKTIDAIIISHEHSDHFDIPSLDALPRVPVYLGALVVKPISMALERLGFEVIIVTNNLPIKIGDMQFRLYPSHPRTAFWESRVHQIYFEQEGDECKFLIGVDALISDTLIDDINNNLLPAPNVIAVSNNSQVTPPGVNGALQNIASDENKDKKKHGLVGLKILDSLTKYLEKLPQPQFILICGGGFMKNYDNFGPFPFSDQDKLGEIMNQLSLNQAVIGLTPGKTLLSNSDTYSIGTLDWIEPDIERIKILEKQREDFLQFGRSVPHKALTGEFKNKKEFLTVLKTIERELDTLAPLIMTSPMGEHALKTSKYRGKLVGDNRFAFVFNGCFDNKKVIYGLNFHNGKFEVDNQNNCSAIEKYPFGLEVSLHDFFCLIKGEIQIWDIAGVAMTSWFECPVFEGPVPFMYSYYGENTCPELLECAINVKLNTLNNKK